MGNEISLPTDVDPLPDLQDGLSGPESDLCTVSLAAAIAAGWCDLFERYFVYIFVTLTFRPIRVVIDKWSGVAVFRNRTASHGGMYPEVADKAFRYFISNINRQIYGPRWLIRWHGGLQWARG
jgi:hypothetical protein